MSTLNDKATELQRLHSDPDLLVLVNVWDVVTARVVADTPGTKALATAGESGRRCPGSPCGWATGPPVSRVPHLRTIRFAKSDAQSLHRYP